MSTSLRPSPSWGLEARLPPTVAPFGRPMLCIAGAALPARPAVAAARSTGAPEMETTCSGASGWQQAGHSGLRCSHSARQAKQAGCRHGPWMGNTGHSRQMGHSSSGPGEAGRPPQVKTAPAGHWMEIVPLSNTTSQLVILKLPTRITASSGSSGRRLGMQGRQTTGGRWAPGVLWAAQRPPASSCAVRGTSWSGPRWE